MYAEIIMARYALHLCGIWELPDKLRFYPARFVIPIKAIEYLMAAKVQFNLLNPHCIRNYLLEFQGRPPSCLSLEDIVELYKFVEEKLTIYVVLLVIIEVALGCFKPDTLGDIDERIELLEENVQQRYEAVVTSEESELTIRESRAPPNLGRIESVTVLESSRMPHTGNTDPIWIEEAQEFIFIPNNQRGHIAVSLPDRNDISIDEAQDYNEWRLSPAMNRSEGRLDTSIEEIRRNEQYMGARKISILVLSALSIFCEFIRIVGLIQFR